MKTEIETNLLRLIELQRKKGDINLTASVGDVVAVDMEQLTIDIKDGDLDLYNVRLNAITGGSDSQLVIIPKVGSQVIYIPFDQSLTTTYAMAFSDIDHIEVANLKLNKGENGGLINIEALTSKLNALVDALNQLKSDFNAHAHTCAAPDSPSTPPMAPSVANPQKFNSADYEDALITH